MKPEYQKIVDDYAHDYGLESMEHIIARVVVQRCKALADKPVRELTDDEIWACSKTLNQLSFARNVIAAHIAKQSEPEVRKVKVYIYGCGEKIITSQHPETFKNYKLLDKFEREVKV